MLYLQISMHRSLLLKVVPPAVGAPNKEALTMPLPEVILEQLDESAGCDFIAPEEGESSVFNGPVSFIVVVVASYGSVLFELHDSEVSVVVLEDPLVGGVSHSPKESVHRFAFMGI
jgi:hypothetical protein